MGAKFIFHETIAESRAPCIFQCLCLFLTFPLHGTGTNSVNSISAAIRPTLLGLVLFFIVNCVVAAPVADFVASNYFPCVNQNITFTSSSSGTITSYSWSFGGNASPSSSTSSGPVSVLFTAAGTYSVSLTVSGPDGSNSVSKTIVVSSSSPVLIGTVTGSGSVCLNGSNLSYSISPVANAGSYNWTVPVGATISSGQGTPSIIASFGSTAGNVCVTAMNGCGTSNQICQTVSIAKEQVVLMNYNLLNYPAQSTISADTTTRHPYFRTIMQYANPDILVVQEVTGSNGVSFFLDKVLNATGNNYSAGTFINGFDSDNAIFFKSSKFTFVSNTPIITDLRDISEFKLIHNLSGDTIRIYSVHLKASNTSPDEAQRALEVDTLRKYTNALPVGSNFIVCGDFNIYRSTESAYQKLLAVTPGVDGHFIDPITMTGTWNNSSYAPYHTQSPRVRAFGGGSTGGLNDRFDLILFSNAMMQSGGISYVPGSTFPLGNDGNHYNDSINQQPNTAVPANIADALHYAADHLPVICNLEFQNSSCPIADLGVSGLVSPSATICSSTSQQIQVTVKNYGTSSINFAFNNLQVSAQVTDPFSIIQNLTSIINSGSLGAGATMTVTLSGNFNMASAGNYSIAANTVFSGDTIPANNSMSPVTVTVYPNISASISAGGPTSLCPGNSVLLSANLSSGVTYQWKKNGVDIVNATSQNYSANQSGSYQVQMQSNNTITTTYPASTFVNSNSYVIPNNICTGASSSIPVSGYVGNIASSGIYVKINIAHTAVGDLVILLQSPSGELLGLSNRTGNSSNTGDNFTNTIFSDLGSTQIPTTGAPYTGTYKPWTSVFASCVSSTKTSFNSLGSGSFNPNGTWKLWVYDRASGNSGGNILNWSITFPSYSISTLLVCDPVISAPINVVVNNNPSISFSPSTAVICSNSGITITASGADSYLWSPSSGLNTNSGATVFANPLSSTIYTVTGTNTFGCSATVTIPVTLYNQPVVTLAPLNSVCVTTASFALTGGLPSGGTYSGPGVVSGIFNPSAAGIGSHTITYSYTDNNGCSSSATQIISVTGFPAATVSPAGPITLCQSSSVNLSTISGYNYLWSTGATTQNISINTPGNYSVVVSDNSGCAATSSTVVVSSSSLPFIRTVFAESMGIFGGTSTIAAYESSNGFDNDALTMSGTAELRATSVSSGYSGASGSANVFITNTAGRNFIISGINSSGLTGLQLSFGIFKSTNASNGSELLVQYSTDSINYFSLPFTPLPTGTGTANWASRTVTGLPASSTLSIQFYQTSTGTGNPQFRIDDVVLTGQVSMPVIYVTGNTNLCQGSSAVLTAETGSNYLWDDGQSTQSITVSNTSTHSCVITCSNGCSALTSQVVVTSNPELYTLSGGGSYCSGSIGPDVTLSGSQLNVNYQLKNNSVNVGSPVAGTGSPINFGSQSAPGNYSVVATHIPTSCTASMTGTVAVNANALPADFNLTGNNSFCTGSLGTLLGLSGSQAGINYQLKLNGNPIGNSIPGNGAAISFGYQNIAGNYSVVATNAGTFCSKLLNTSLTVTQNISPIAFSLSGGGGICQGGAGVPISLQSSQIGVNYSLFNTNGSTGINFNGTGSSVLFGTFNSPSDYHVLATDLSSGCQIEMNDTVSVYLLPAPTLFSVTGGGSFCSVPDLGVAVGLSNSESGVIYELFRNSLSTGNVLNGTGSALNFGNQNVSGTYTVVATKTSSACSLTMNSTALVVRNSVSTWYIDSDNDGFGNPAIFILDCDQPSGYISDNTDCNDAAAAENPGAVEICGNNIDDNCDGRIDEDCNVVLNLKAFIQGYYINGSTQRSPLNSVTLSDTIIIKLAGASAPHSILFADTTFIAIDGSIAASFPSAVLNSEYYIVIEHRNSIETWSSNSLLFNLNVIDYDFTNALNKSYGNNSADNGDGTFSLFSGDVNKDGQIDFNDYQLLESSTNNFPVNYNVLDLTGDNNVESSDFSIIENNFIRSIVVNKP